MIAAVALMVASQAQGWHTFDVPLAKSIAGDRIGTLAFHRDLQTELTRLGITIRWQKIFGPTPIRVGILMSKDSPSGVFAVWPGKTGAQSQVLQILNTDTPPANDFYTSVQVYRKGNRLVCCGSVDTGGNFSVCGATVYRMRGDAWKQVASEMDAFESLPGTHFMRRHNRVDSHTIIATLQGNPPHLDQPAAGPVFVVDETWTIRNYKIAHGGRRLIQTPLVELDRLAGLAQSGKRFEFNVTVPVRYRKALWQLLKDKVVVFCQHDREGPYCPDLTVWDGEIHPKGFRPPTMHFAKRQGAWRLVSATSLNILRQGS
jgi:hypothetical protein